MTKEQLIMLKKIISTASAYYGKQLTDEAIRMYADDLSDLDYFKVFRAMQSYRLDTKNRQMFLPANIREIVNPNPAAKDLARVTAIRIREAVGKFGWPNPEEAEAFIGHEGWKYVERFGGWKHLCENLGVDIQETTFLAQARDAIESTINLQRAGLDMDKPALGQVKELQQGRVDSVIKQLSQKTAMEDKDE